MYGLRRLLLEEVTRLEHIMTITKERLEGTPEGKLRLSNWKGYPQYYYCTENDKRGTYIRKERKEIVQKLAQKQYDEQVLRLAEKRISQLKRITKDYQDDEMEQLFYKEHIERQKFIQPIEPTWKQRLAEWEEKEYTGKEFSDEMPVILTEKGERVRSKSEKIMADYFFRKGIPYKYECPLFLKGIGTVYPDFTFLTKKAGKEIYWEHNGKMDDPVYAKNAIRKIKAYENNGILQGERLILTYETGQDILNTSEIEMLVKRFLL